MLVAAFGPTTGWAGRQITWDGTRFVLAGHGPITAAGLVEYDRLGQLQWTSSEVREWAFSVARWEASAAPPMPRPAGAGAGAGTRRGFPAWAIILIIAAVLVLVLGILSAILIPAVFIRAGETIADKSAVRSGVRTIQTAVETWALDNGGAYPDTFLVNSSGLNRYLSPWPTNPYTDLPMMPGVGPGDYRYEVGADGGSYRLVAYAKDGGMLIDVRSTDDGDEQELPLPACPTSRQATGAMAARTTANASPAMPM
ncbi:MAG: hypothetical protein WCP98_07105 [Actinomycetes bacterium]